MRNAVYLCGIIIKNYAYEKSYFDINGTRCFSCS